MSKRVIAIILILVTALALVIIPRSVKTDVVTADGSSTSQEEISTETETTTQASAQTQTSSETETTTPTEITSQPTVENDEPTTAGMSVSANGMLRVDNDSIVNSRGEVYQLRGVSTHGISWFPAFVNKDAFKSLRDDWGINAIRLACYSQSGIYRGQTDIDLVKQGIDACIELDMYVIVDWHILGDGNPNTEKANAKEFFEQIAKAYADCPNVIYELCNEPNGSVSWNGQIKPYCEEIIPIIRDKCDNIIVAGTGTWSQDVHDVVGNTLADENVCYAVHFYADTHREWLRERVANVRAQGICVLISEFGTCDASGGGSVNKSETEDWLRFLDENDIGYFNWSLADKAETCSIVKPGSSATGGWTESDLTESGKLYLNWTKALAQD